MVRVEPEPPGNLTTKHGEPRPCIHKAFYVIENRTVDGQDFGFVYRPLGGSCERSVSTVNTPIRIETSWFRCPRQTRSGVFCRPTVSGLKAWSEPFSEGSTCIARGTDLFLLSARRRPRTAHHENGRPCLQHSRRRDHLVAHVLIGVTAQKHEPVHDRPAFASSLVSLVWSTNAKYLPSNLALNSR